MAQEIQLKQVTPRVFMSPPDSGFYEQVTQTAIILPNFIVVVDCNLFPTDAQRFRKAVEKKFSRPIKYTILTHFHTDHIGGSAVFADSTVIGSFILAQKLRKEILPGFSKAREKYLAKFPERAAEIQNMRPIVPELVFAESMTLIGDDSAIECRFAGGHTPGSSYVYFPDEEVVVAGDLLWQNRIPNSSGTWSDPDRWIAQLKVIEDLGAKYYIPGHGDLVLAEDLPRYRRYLESMREAVRENIDADSAKVENSFPEIYPMGEPKYRQTRQKNIARWQLYYCKEK